MLIDIFGRICFFELFMMEQIPKPTMLHVLRRFPYMVESFMEHVCKYTSPMEHMGDATNSQWNFLQWTVPCLPLRMSRTTTNWCLDADRWVNQGFYHQTFQVPKIEVLTSVSCMDTAYVRETPYHVWYLKLFLWCQARIVYLEQVGWNV